MNKEEIESIRDLVDVTFRDLYLTIINSKDETVDINCYFLIPPKEIKLPFAELWGFKSSAKGFINYLKEKVTEGLGLNILDQLLRIKQAADDGTSLISNQGQALDGYSELANYRAVIEKFKKEKSE